jgi:hypothetical protein
VFGHKHKEKVRKELGGAFCYHCHSQMKLTQALVGLAKFGDELSFVWFNNGLE